MNTTPNQGSIFRDVCTVTRTGERSFSAVIDPGWTIMGNPNGGYLQTVMVNAAAELSDGHPHPVAVSTHFLRSPRPGAVGLTAELLRTGRTTSQVRVRMTQGTAVTGETVVTFGTLEVAGEPGWTSVDLPPAAHPFADCTRYLPPDDPFPVAILHRVGLYPEPGQPAFTTGKGRGLGEVRAWVELPGAEDFTPASLLLAADVLPPATFDIRPAGWVPTIELSTYLRALPAPGPVNVLLKANLIQGERVDETATVWDSTGALVAQSHQLAGIRFS